jgi:hypothetical protein
MGRPIKEKSLDGATSTGAGDTVEAGGKITLGLFVTTDSSPTTLDVEAEVSYDGTNWTPFSDAAGNQELVLSASDFTQSGGSGNYSAFVSAHGVAAPYVRARITGYSSGGNVTAWIGATSNPQTSYDFRDTGA